MISPQILCAFHLAGTRIHSDCPSTTLSNGNSMVGCWEACCLWRRGGAAYRTGHCLNDSGVLALVSIHQTHIWYQLVCLEERYPLPLYNVHPHQRPVLSTHPCTIRNIYYKSTRIYHTHSIFFAPLPGFSTEGSSVIDGTMWASQDKTCKRLGGQKASLQLPWFGHTAVFVGLWNKARLVSSKQSVWPSKWWVYDGSWLTIPMSLAK